MKFSYWKCIKVYLNLEKSEQKIGKFESLKSWCQTNYHDLSICDWIASLHMAPQLKTL